MRKELERINQDMLALRNQLSLTQQHLDEAKAELKEADTVLSE